MPLIYQYRIYRQDLLNNPDVRYIFGDNVQRIGLGGQAKEMRGAPNAIGVATKWYPAMSPDSFFSDDKFEEQKTIIFNDLVPAFQAMLEGRIVVFPLEGIGSGLSEMPTRAPKTWDYLMRLTQALSQVKSQ